MQVTISLIILRVHNHPTDRAGRTQTHIMVNIVMLCRLMSLAQPLLKGISEISEILFLRSLRYYLWDLWDNISLLQLELWLFFSLDGIHIGYLADEGCLFRYPFCRSYYMKSVFVICGCQFSSSLVQSRRNMFWDSYAMTLDLNWKVKKYLQKYLDNIKYFWGSRTVLNSEYDVKSFLLQKYLGRLK